LTIWRGEIGYLTLSWYVMILKVFVGEVGYSLDRYDHPLLMREMRGYVKQNRRLE